MFLHFSFYKTVEIFGFWGTRLQSSIKHFPLPRAPAPVEARRRFDLLGEMPINLYKTLGERGDWNGFKCNITWINMTWVIINSGWIRQDVSSKFGEQEHSVAEEHHLHCTHQSGQFDNGNWRHSGDDSGFVGGFKLRFRSLDAAYIHDIQHRCAVDSKVFMLDFFVEQFPQSLKKPGRGTKIDDVNSIFSWCKTPKPYFHWHFSTLALAPWASMSEILRMGECQRSGHMMLLVLKSHGCYLQLVAGALGWLIGRDKCQSGVEKIEIIHRSLRDGGSFRFPWCSDTYLWGLIDILIYVSIYHLSRIYCVIIM